MTMRQIRASVFKARCLAIMDNVQSTGEPVIVTKRGTPVVKVVPIQAGGDDLFGFMAGRLKVVGDIESPLVPLKQWKITKK
jgi:prevent-host-death family protein